jgi:hypothetical protein
MRGHLIMESLNNDMEQYDYAKLLKQPEWQAKRETILAKTMQCETCGRFGRNLAVHHKYYLYGVLPWEHPEDAYQVLCNGKCHSEADAKRADQEEDAKLHRRHGWQGALGKACQIPSERELKKLASYEPEFTAWLWREKILKEGWNWQLHPLWELWNVLAPDFFAKRANYDPQGYLNL